MRRSQRLTSSRDFAKAREEGRAYKDHHLVMIIRPNHLGTTRFGFVTGKRLGNAVTRNRSRRLMREAVRRVSDCIPGGFDVVVIAGRRSVGAGYQEICRSVEELAGRAGLLRETH